MTSLSHHIKVCISLTCLTISLSTYSTALLPHHVCISQPQYLHNTILVSCTDFDLYLHINAIIDIYMQYILLYVWNIIRKSTVFQIFWIEHLHIYTCVFFLFGPFCVSAPQAFLLSCITLHSSAVLTLLPIIRDDES